MWTWPIARKHAHSACYISRLKLYDHRARELEFRKRYGGCEIEEGIHDATSKRKGQDILSVLPAVTCPVQTARRAGQRMM